MSVEPSVLSADRVESIFLDCLYRGAEDGNDHMIVDGIVHNVSFHPGRIDKHRQEIHDMLTELPDELKVSGGGGWSFLQAGMDKHGNQWTSLHLTMEQLVQLGLAINEVEYCLPRHLWGFFPDGMPYFVIKQ